MTSLGTGAKFVEFVGILQFQVFCMTCSHTKITTKIHEFEGVRI